MARKIVILETQEVFDTISAAAKHVGVDPSNARKVIIGKRASASGYHFAEINTKTAKRDIERAQENVVQNVFRRKKERILSKVKRNLINSVHDLLVDVNKRARNAAREGLIEQDPVLKKMMSHTDFYGQNKTGGYITSKQHLRQFSEDELKNLVELIANERAEYAQEFYSNKSKNRNIASYAFQFGLTNKQMEQYWYILPTLFEMFAAAKKKTEFEYRTIKDEISEIMQANAGLPSQSGEKDILDYLIDLENFYKGNTSEDLDELLTRWSTSRKKWIKRLEEVKK